MKIDSLKDLEAIIKLCRKTGVQSISLDGIEISLGDAPVKKTQLVSEAAESVKTEGMPTDEELLFWSSN